MKRRERILVAMSGGVDSSVAAALLAREGHDVEGVTLRMISDSDFSGKEKIRASIRNPERDAEDARRVARLLRIRHRVVDVAADFRLAVIGPFLNAYARGFTPVPCLACNREVKFLTLFRQANELGADAVATGHYATMLGNGGGPRLGRPADSGRDQTYFLFDLPAQDLPRLRFPLGGMLKEDIRSVAANLGLEIAGKPASREVCFVPSGDTRRYLGRHLPLRPGPILDSAGKRLGTHSGIHFFTVGQRRGLGLSLGRPLHVLFLNRESDAVVVGPEEELYSMACIVEKARFFSPVSSGLKVEAKIRSRQPAVGALLEPMEPGRVRVRFARPQRAVTPGQAAVFYSGREVLGGGLIAAAERSACREAALTG